MSKALKTVGCGSGGPQNGKDEETALFAKSLQERDFGGLF